jgi:ATP-dependent RNA helicase RhlE
VIRRQVPREIVAGFEPNPHERAEPIVRQRGQGKSGYGQRERQHPSTPRRSSQGQPHKNIAEQTSRHQPSSKSNGGPVRTAEAHAKPKHPRPAPQPRRSIDSASTVRTNIPGLVQPSHRRGR